LLPQEMTLSDESTLPLPVPLLVTVTESSCTLTATIWVLTRRPTSSTAGALAPTSLRVGQSAEAPPVDVGGVRAAADRS
jgi:hypothetical protein